MNPLGMVVALCLCSRESEASKHHVIANDENVDLLKLLRLGAMDHAAATGFNTICFHWSFIAHRNIH